MLRERNTFVLKARSGSDERQHALTLNVNLREQDLSHFNGRNGAGGSKAVQQLLEMLDEDEAFQALIREIDDLRQLDQLVKTKAKDGTHTLELSDMTVQWQVSEEPGLPTVLQRVQGDPIAATAETAGKYRPLPVRRLVVAVWMYPPHVEIPPTGDRIPTSDAAKQDFFVDADDDSVDEADE
ncbi:hypothetical protein KRP22_010116 [Phytophthora ramorum]|uniref:uncharacterized protein n=1 Tax=Phytophthora ramorum TaxID=164328 RepID=UPI0030990352|nr:hypothetical protein KRP23_6634 [Phytophthora ramorum]KAH7505543.1 hypothetical protein KRP22_6014 [Phytophthora ramorum]